MIYVKIHENAEAGVLAVCDEDLIGKSFEEGVAFLEVREEFYKRELKNEKEVVEMLIKFNNLNIVGRDSIKLAVDVGVVSREDVISVGGVEHACVYSA